MSSAMISITAILEALTHLSAISKAFLVLTTIAIILRIVTRAGILGRLESDDWVMIVAWLCFVAICGMTLQVGAVIHGAFTGHPVNIKSLELIVKFDTGLYIICMVLIKLSLSLFFLRIFAAHLPQRIIIHCILVVTLVFSLVYFFMSMCTCGLTKGFFPTAKECGVWHAYSQISVAWSSFNAGTDIIFSIISVYAIWTANLPRRTKAYASLVLVFGTCGGIASIIRIVVLSRAGAGPAAYAVGLNSGYWTLIEAGIGISATCLATLRPLLRLCRDKFANTVSRSDRPTDVATDTANIVSSTGVSKGMTGLSSALSDAHPKAPQLHDWRMDRIPPEMEFCHPNAAIIGSVITMEEHPARRERSLQTHNLV